MTNPDIKPFWSPRNTLLAALLLAVIAGASTGLATSLLARPGPAPQTRVFYLFVKELGFNTSLTTGGLKSSYVYTTDRIIVNKGDTVAIHFYNPTDDDHTLTIDSPYTNDVVVPAAPTSSSPIQNRNVTFTANTGGVFGYHCRFHTPQMIGSIVVQG